MYFCCKQFAVQHSDMHDLEKRVQKALASKVIYATKFLGLRYHIGVCATARRPQNDRFVFTRAPHTPVGRVHVVIILYNIRIRSRNSAIKIHDDDDDGSIL